MHSSLAAAKLLPQDRAGGKYISEYLIAYHLLETSQSYTPSGHLTAIAKWRFLLGFLDVTG